MGTKEDLIEAAAELFATRGFEGSTTLEIARTAGVTEPMIYYHFKGKHDLFTYILAEAFEEFFSLLKAVDVDASTEFKKIEKLFEAYYEFVARRPRETSLILGCCPPKLKDAEETCRQNFDRLSSWLEKFLTRCLKKGIRAGEFKKVPVPQTVNLIVLIIQTLARQRALDGETVPGMKEAAVGFCKRSLVKSF
ncbi:MAG: TetR/AcrR family transcriptional regulator [Desulfobacterales bacterium]